jgi:putative peptidoglycan lipid II flippase
VQVLLQRGAFDAHSTAWVASALAFYAIGLVGHSAVEILSRAFYALHDTLRPVLVGLGAMGLNIILSLLLGRPAEAGGMGHTGLALANSTATLLEMIVLMGLLARRAGGLPWGEMSASLGRITLSAGAMGMVLWSFMYYLGESSAWLTALGGITIGALMYLLASLLVRAPEPRGIWHMVSRRPA